MTRSDMSNGGDELDTLLEEVQERLVSALRGLKFGSVEIQIHDSRVVRITRTEKIIVEGPRSHKQDGPSKLNRPPVIGRSHATISAGLEEQRTSKDDPTLPTEARLQQGTKHP
jgi:hypothetical protein